MSRLEAEVWTDWNQRRLVEAVDGVRRSLERHAAVATPIDENDSVAGETDATPEGPSALESLCHAFDLSPFERAILVLCAGSELDARIAPLCAAAHADPAAAYPTFGLALSALEGAHWSALAPGSSLRHWRLIQLMSGDSMTSAPLRIDERILHYLTGINQIDERLTGHVQPVWESEEPGGLPGSHQALVARIAEHWADDDVFGGTPPIQLCGLDRGAKEAIGAAACAAAGLRLYRIRAADIPAGVEERETFARLWEREVVLARSALLIDLDDVTGAEERPALAGFVERIRGVLLLTGQEPMGGLRRGLVRLEVRKPTPDEQHALWVQSLGASAAHMNGQLREIVAHFDLPTLAIRSASRRLPTGGEADADARLWEICRVEARPRLDDLATRLTATAGWDDLVLPDAQRRILAAIAIHVRRRARVYGDWGFSGRSARGLGISALFSGPSGTGKTLAAEVLAKDLHLDLYHIDLSSVVSKYIGETEKNLRRVFDAAEDGGAILLFDEADAIFGKRSEVKDSHDRYANLEVSYLLQRMEAYRGLAILTTNFQEALDSAFMRRIRFIVQFPFPGLEQRREIWRRIFPKQTPTEGLDANELGRLNIAGGDIRNIALGAAFLAADAGEPVRMAHVVSAARQEYAKLQRPVSELDLGGRS